MFTFHGGIHPYDGKDISKDKPIVDYKPKGLMVYPLSQHIGAPAEPVVEIGEHVLVGQLIAKETGFVSSPIYSSVSGTVKAIEPRRIITGDHVKAIVIENDGAYDEVEFTPNPDYTKLSREEIVSLIQKAGIVGMGGAGFPTHVKVSPKEPDKIEYIIANCAECEPYLTSDYRIMIETPEKLVEGLRIELSLFNNARGILAIEDNKPDCIKILKELTKNEDKITVIPLKTKYPQGSERHLIFATTKRAINSSMLPADAGCIVNNVDTICSIYQAVVEGRTNYHELIDEAGGFIKEPEKIISGGPMMGFAIFDLDVPATKTSSALLCLSKDQISSASETACINCGRCVEVCPGRVIPSKLADFAQNGNREMFEKYNGMECCECGCCSYICPAKRYLTQSIKSMRRMILADRKKGGK